AARAGMPTDTMMRARTGEDRCVTVGPSGSRVGRPRGCVQGDGRPIISAWTPTVHALVKRYGPGPVRRHGGAAGVGATFAAARGFRIAAEPHLADRDLLRDGVGPAQNPGAPGQHPSQARGMEA